MTANKELMYWHANKEWWFYNKKTQKIELTEKAPQRAIESFKKWRETAGDNHVSTGFEQGSQQV